jgi:hypothetical protein
MGVPEPYRLHCATQLLDLIGQRAVDEFPDWLIVAEVFCRSCLRAVPRLVVANSKLNSARPRTPSLRHNLNTSRRRPQR